MSQDIFMPRFSDTMEEGTISRWLKHEGDRVEKGDVLAEIETDKANMEYPAVADGVLQRILVKEGDTVKIGEVIAVLGGEGESTEAPPAATEQAPATPEQAREAEAPTAGQQAKAATEQGVPPGEEAAAAQPATPTPREGAVTRSGGPRPSGEVTSGEAAPEGGRLFATPIARRLAKERDIDLRQVKGSGPGGRIVREDIEGYQARPAEAPTPAEAPAPAPSQPAAPEAAGVRREPMSRMQQVIARRMVESKTQVPHFYVSNEVDMDAVLELRQRLNEGMEKEQQVRLEAIIIRACALALKKSPIVNASYRGKENEFEYHDYVNIGHAVAVPDGLVVPVVRDCDRKGIRQIDQDMRANIERARANKLTPADLDRGTFSVSNMGMFDVDEFAAVVNPPNAAILAIPSSRPVAAVVDGQVNVRQRIKFTLSCDHRILYGAIGAQFLQELKRLLHAPYGLLL